MGLIRAFGRVAEIVARCRVDRCPAAEGGGGDSDGAPVVDCAGDLGPCRSESCQVVGCQVVCRTQGFVGEETDDGPGRAVVGDRFQVGGGDTVVVSLGPGSVAAAVGVDEPRAECGDDGHAPSGVSVGQWGRVGVVEETEVLRRHDRLLHDLVVFVEACVGAPSVVGDGHGAVGVERDAAVSAVAGLGLVRRIGDDFANQAPKRAWCYTRKPLVCPSEKYAGAVITGMRMCVFMITSYGVG